MKPCKREKGNREKNKKILETMIDIKILKMKQIDKF